MTVDELLVYPGRWEFAAMPEMDALTEEDALQEANLLDVRFGFEQASLAMLFDLRVSLQFRMANTAVLVMREVSRAEFVRTGPPGFPFAPPVMASIAGVDNSTFTFELVCLGGSRLRAASAAAEFFVGDIPSLPEAPPDFGESDERTIAAGMPAWGASFRPEWATFIDKVDPGAQ